MSFKNYIPAWSYSNKKKEAQFRVSPSQSTEIDPNTGEAQRMARYQGVMTYEVRVPAQPENIEAEQQAAEIAASNLYEKVWKAVGDEVPTHSYPEKYA